MAKRGKHSPLFLTDRMVPLIALLVFVACYFGSRWLLLNYGLSRDEQMADFDAMIFMHGKLAWPLPTEWRRDAEVLNLLYVVPTGGNQAWASFYLPFNAAIRAAFSHIGDPSLAGPVYNALSLLLLWSCGRRLWPEDREAATVSLLLLVLSGQFLFAGMTAFAMPAHLFFNLLWLRLFLAQRVSADLAALVVGFVATGLHQPLFHPLFAAPFLLLILRDRDWRRAAVFAAGYIVTASFWLLWPQIAEGTLFQPGLASSATSGGLDFESGANIYMSRLADIVTLDGGNIVYTMENLLRFCAWQHLLLPPLLLVSWAVARTDRLARAMSLSLLVPVVLLALIVPWQGNGFGYRYIHGALGCAALLGGYGWRRLAGCHERLRPMFRWATAATALIVLPIQAWMAHDYYAPSARASASIDASGADYAVIASDADLMTRDLVQNQPDLSNLPIRLLSEQIGDIDVLAKRICRPGVTVALTTEQFIQPVIARYGELDFRASREFMPRIRHGLEHAGCRTLLLH